MAPVIFSGVVSHPGDLQLSQYVVSMRPHLRLIISLICDLIVSYIDSLMGKETVMWTKFSNNCKSYVRGFRKVIIRYKRFGYNINVMHSSHI